jgi:hypothetical protein
MLGGIAVLLLAMSGRSKSSSQKTSPPSPGNEEEGDIHSMFRNYGIADFTPEDFLYLRKWDEYAELPEEYNLNLVAAAYWAQRLQDRLPFPIVVKNGFRPPDYNEAVDGAKNSAHIRAAAFDAEVHPDYKSSSTTRQMHEESARLWLENPDELAGLGVYFGRVHLDVHHPDGLGRRSWPDGDRKDTVIASARSLIEQDTAIV